MKRYKDITGVVLAQGLGGPAGAGKAMTLFDGKPFIQHVAETLAGVFDDVAVVSDNRDEYSFLRLPVYTSIIKDRGPLGGIHSALVNIGTEDAFIVSCDIPFLRSSIIRYVIRHAGSSDIAILETDTLIQPLCGLYRSTCILPILRNTLKGRHSLQTLMNQVSTRAITPDAKLRPMVRHALLSIASAEGRPGNLAFSM